MSGKYHAVNVADLTAYAQVAGGINPVTLLLTPLLSEETVQTAANRWDEVALLVRSDIDEERWAAVYQILRKGAGDLKAVPKWGIRIYESQTGSGGWKRI